MAYDYIYINGGTDVGAAQINYKDGSVTEVNDFSTLAMTVDGGYVEFSSGDLVKYDSNDNSEWTKTLSSDVNTSIDRPLATDPNSIYYSRSTELVSVDINDGTTQWTADTYSNYNANINHVLASKEAIAVVSNRTTTISEEIFPELFEPSDGSLIDSGGTASGHESNAEILSTGEILYFNSSEELVQFGDGDSEFIYNEEVIHTASDFVDDMSITDDESIVYIKDDSKLVELNHSGDVQQEITIDNFGVTDVEALPGNKVATLNPDANEIKITDLSDGSEVNVFTFSSVKKSGNVDSYVTYPSAPNSGAWETGPTIISIESTQTSSTTITSSGSVSLFDASATAVSSSATPETPSVESSVSIPTTQFTGQSTPLESGVTSATVNASTVTSTATQLITSVKSKVPLTATQITSSASPLQPDVSKLKTILSATQASSLSVINDGSVSASLSSSQASSLSSVNTGALLEFLESSVIQPSSSMNDGSLSNFTLGSEQFGKVSEPNVTTVDSKIALTSSQISADVFNNTPKVGASLSSAGVGVSSSPQQGSVSLSASAEQETVASSLNNSTTSLVSINSTNTGVGVELNNTGQEFLVVVPSTQPTAAASENTTTVDLSLTSTQERTAVFTADAETLFTSFIDVSQVQADALMNGAFAAEVQGVLATVASEMNTAESYFFADTKSLVLQPIVTLSDANSVVGQGESSVLFKNFANVTNLFEIAESQTSGQKVQVTKDTSLIQITGSSETESTLLFPLKEVTTTDGAPSVYPLDSVLSGVDVTVVSSDGIYTVPVQSQIIGVSSGVRSSQTLRQGFNIDNTVSEDSNLVSVASKPKESDISVTVTRQYGDRTSVNSG